MRRRGPQRTRELLRLLDESGFEFIVVGGVAGTLHGSTLNTIDLDVVSPFTVENLRRLLTALSPYDPHHASRLDLPGITEPVETRPKDLMVAEELAALADIED